VKIQSENGDKLTCDTFVNISSNHATIYKSPSTTTVWLDAPEQGLSNGACLVSISLVVVEIQAIMCDAPVTGTVSSKLSPIAE
jgi:hypothetical protein